MNKQTRKLLQAWRDDLRTTTAKQGQSVLKSTDNRYCCLGRLCVVTGEEIFGRKNKYNCPPSVPNGEHHPIAIDLLWELDDGYMYRDDWSDAETLFTTMNDDMNMTFQEIADILDVILLETEHGEV